MSADMASVGSVSVPSTGRSGLQPKRSGCLRVCHSGFSTLYGSKWVATGCSMLANDLNIVSFSTLYGSKWVATVSWIRHVYNREQFQYPLRVEVGCNRA